MKSLKKNLFELMESPDISKAYVRYFRMSILLLIALNVLVVILETVDSINIKYQNHLHLFEVVSVFIFTLEYVCRLWVCTESKNFRGPLAGRLKFALTPLALVDLFAILPFYLPLFFAFDLRFMRALRLIRIFRILKFGRYSESLKLIIRVFENKKEELLISLFTVFVLLIIASSFMFYFEHEVQPDKFSSIPATMWWALITLTTVGYGDVYPVTIPGKLLGSVLAILGVGIFALPAAILASAFTEEMRLKNNPSSARVDRSNIQNEEN